MVHLGDVNPSIWDQIVEVMEEKLKHIEFQEEDIAFNWRPPADSKMLDRELYEVYGVFKDVILHPKFQFCKQFLEENVSFDFVQGDPLLPLTTTVIMLFMLHKRVSNNILLLAAAFIYNVNPFYVCLIVATYWYSQSGSKKPKMFLAAKNKTYVKQSSISTEPITYSEDLNITATVYEHVLLGNDLSTLYTAALLTKNGHKCCVLQPKGSPPTSSHPVGAPYAVPTANPTVGRVERYQSLLDIVQSNEKSLRVSFSPVGSVADCFTHTVLRVASASKSSRASFTTWLLRAGAGGVASEFCGKSSSEKSVLMKFLQSVLDIQASVTTYLILKTSPTTKDTKVTPAPAFGGSWPVDGDKFQGSAGLPHFKNLCSSSVEQVLSQLPDLDPSIINALSAACTIGAEEALSASNCSGYALTSLLSNTEQGMFFPNGGYKAVEGALVRAVRAGGGEVYGSVPVKEIALKGPDSDADADLGAGVKRAVGVEINRGTGHDSADSIVHASRSVISGVGALCTYTRLLPSSAVSAAMRLNLVNLSESRPKILVLVWLKGSILDLGLSSSDYVEVPSQPQPALPTPARPNTAFEAQEDFVGAHFRIWSPSAKDAEWATNNTEDAHCVIVELEPRDPTVSLQRHPYSAPPARPSEAVAAITDEKEEAVLGPVIFTAPNGKDTTSSTALGAGVCRVGCEAVMRKSDEENARSRALLKLAQIYPLTSGKVVFSHVLPPTLGGHRIAGTPAKYCSLGLTATSDIPGLFLCGRDIATNGTGGDIQGGWMAANAALGYTAADLMAGHNIASDLQKVSQ